MFTSMKYFILLVVSLAIGSQVADSLGDTLRKSMARATERQAASLVELEK